MSTEQLTRAVYDLKHEMESHRSTMSFTSDSTQRLVQSIQELHSTIADLNSNIILLTQKLTPPESNTLLETQREAT